MFTCTPLSAVPGPCEAPVITNVTKDKMTVSWKEPVDDGKSTILGYIVEKKETKEMKWTKINKKTLTERSLEVTGLTEGIEYEFRVIAVNMAGLGKPSEPSEGTTAQDPISKFQTPIHIIKRTIFCYPKNQISACCLKLITVVISSSSWTCYKPNCDRYHQQHNQSHLDCTS